MTVLQAEAMGVRNFSLFCNHITIIPTVKAILDSPDLQIDGFLGPGHVSMVIGTRPYEFIAQRYGRPLVVAGFEPLDILQSLQSTRTMLRSHTAAAQDVIEFRSRRASEPTLSYRATTASFR